MRSKAELKIVLLAVAIFIAGCAAKAPPYLGESANSSPILGRISFEKTQLFVTTPGYLNYITAADGSLALDRKDIVERFKKYKTIDLAPDHYTLATVCEVNNHLINTAIEITVESDQETILGCEVYKLEEKNILGLKKRAVRVVVVEQKSISTQQ